MHGPGNEHQRTLADCEPFSGLPDDLLERLMDRMDETTFAEGEKLIHQDIPASSLQLILEGRAAVVVAAGMEAPTEVAEVSVGDVIGEMALISGEPTSADVVARTPMRVLELAADDFHDLARRHPEIAVVLTRLISERLGRSDADALGGKHIHGYRIVRCIGRGGMAMVYEAIRDSDGKRFALKMMSHKLAYDTTALSRFREETKIVSGLDHENLAKRIEGFSAYGTQFIVVEYCEGPGLERVTGRRVPIAENLVRPITGQLANALEYIHGKGVLHRDVKPSNTMLTPEGGIKLIDFGVARPIEHGGDRTKTLETSVVGTPFYMAPEQLEETLGIDEKVDNYALACMTYELLAGNRLIKKGTTIGMWQQKQSLELPPPHKIGHGISEEMHSFLRRNLNADPTRRPDSVAAQAAWRAPIDVDALPLVR
ncbi:MAG: protein kinase [Acidobacteriota bacterium]|nr:protein kinase [Acidobacteriota bacterium]